MIFKWVAPLGFLGLLSILILILIYLLKPKYREKMISSTYIWKIALRYRKKRVPIDIFRNLLLFLCQVLILTGLSVILAQPALFSEDILEVGPESVFILDGSANMHVRYADVVNGETRFERAINEVKLSIDELLIRKDGVLSVILADDAPHYILQDKGRDDYTEVVTTLESAECSMGGCDMAEAVKMAQERILRNPEAKIYIYSGTEFGSLGKAVKVTNLADKDREWNIGILDCTASLEENEYVFYIDLAAYGKVSAKVTLNVTIKGADNGDGATDFPTLKVPVTFDVEEKNGNLEQKQTVVVRATDQSIGGDAEWFFESYEEIAIDISDLNDSFPMDDSFKIYGGQKDILKFQYYSTKPNSFFHLATHILQSTMSKERKISFVQIASVMGETPATKGYDYYIYEHGIPDVVLSSGLPRDGVVILWDPKSGQSAEGLGLEFHEEVYLPSFGFFETGKDDPLLQYMDTELLGVTCYTRVTVNDSGYKTLLTCNGDPVLLVKNTKAQKIVVLPFSINLSNFYGREFLTFLFNLINEYMPLTLSEYEFDLGGNTYVNCKGSRLTMESPSGEMQSFGFFPTQVEFTELGTYVFTTYFENSRPEEVRKVFVRIPSSESVIFRISDLRAELENDILIGQTKTDLFVYFAAVLLGLLLLEWILKFKSA